MPKIGKQVNLVIMLIDMKDFTTKTSLLTRSEINEILKMQDHTIIPAISEYDGNIIKSMGDGYLITFESPTDSILCAIDIQKAVIEFNAKQKETIKHIEFRISANLGEVALKETVVGQDIFGEPVNIAARLLHFTPENSIYITSSIFDTMNKNEVQALNLGYMKFKGIPEKIKVYGIITDPKESEELILQRMEKAKLSSGLGKVPKSEVDEIIIDSEKLNEAEKIIFNFSSLAAFSTLHPFPFADYYISIPLQTYMIIKIANNYGIKLTFEIAKAMFFQFITILGFEYLSKYLILSLYKIGLPFIGAYINIPFSFSITYGLGKAVNAHFYYKSRNLQISDEKIKALFIEKRLDGLSFAKIHKDKIMETGRKIRASTMESVNYMKEHSNEFLKESKKQKELLSEQGKQIFEESKKHSEKFLQDSKKYSNTVISKSKKQSHERLEQGKNKSEEIINKSKKVD